MRMRKRKKESDIEKQKESKKEEEERGAMKKSRRRKMKKDEERDKASKYCITECFMNFIRLYINGIYLFDYTLILTL